MRLHNIPPVPGGMHPAERTEEAGDWTGSFVSLLGVGRLITCRSAEDEMGQPRRIFLSGVMRLGGTYIHTRLSLAGLIDRA